MSEKKEKKERKYLLVGQIVRNEFEGREYSMLKLGSRFNKSGKLANGIELSDEEKEALLQIILTKDLYLFDPAETAPEFIAKNVAVKIEDLKGSPEKPKQKEEKKQKGKVKF